MKKPANELEEFADRRPTAKAIGGMNRDAGIGPKRCRDGADFSYPDGHTGAPEFRRRPDDGRFATLGRPPDPR